MVAQKIEPKKKETDSLGSVVLAAFTRPQFKIIVLLFIVFMALSNDIFINRILDKINGAVESPNVPSTYGTVIQGIILVVFYIAIDVLVRHQLV